MWFVMDFCVTLSNLPIIYIHATSTLHWKNKVMKPQRYFVEGSISWRGYLTSNWLSLPFFFTFITILEEPYLFWWDVAHTGDDKLKQNKVQQWSSRFMEPIFHIGINGTSLRMILEEIMPKISSIPTVWMSSRQGRCYLWSVCWYKTVSHESV